MSHFEPGPSRNPKVKYLNRKFAHFKFSYRPEYGFSGWIGAISSSQTALWGCQTGLWVVTLRRFSWGANGTILQAGVGPAGVHEGAASLYRLFQRFDVCTMPDALFPAIRPGFHAGSRHFGLFSPCALQNKAENAYTLWNNAIRRKTSKRPFVGLEIQGFRGQTARFRAPLSKNRGLWQSLLPERPFIVA